LNLLHPDRAHHYLVAGLVRAARRGIEQSRDVVQRTGQYVVVSKRVITALWEQGLSSEAYRRAEQERQAIAAQIEELVAPPDIGAGRAAANMMSPDRGDTPQTPSQSSIDL